MNFLLKFRILKLRETFGQHLGTIVNFDCGHRVVVNKQQASSERVMQTTN